MGFAMSVTKLKFKVGQLVRTGENSIFKIISIDPDLSFPITAENTNGNRQTETFTIDGRYRVDDSFPQFNIVEIVAEPEAERGQVGQRVPLDQSKVSEIANLARDLFIQDFKLGSDNAAPLARSAIAAAITFYQEVKNRGI